MTHVDERTELPPPPPATSGPAERVAHGTVAGRMALGVAGLGLGLVGVHALGIPTPACPLRLATGFPCPFCGLTHVAQHVVTGQVGAVASADPAGLVLAAMLAVAVVLQLIAVFGRRSGPAFMAGRGIGIAVLVVLGVHWMTTIVTGGALTL